MSIRIGLVVYFELRSVKRSVVTAMSETAKESKNPKFEKFKG